ncbi:disease resistance protein Roq1-like [Prosopis cineraria]|uniref:disease resistance protein Roq1-like n=1 Tax=Prosopis cineraria TaxID=364024 RepID=UPI00240FCFBA|nr:disease resistance protein Roq1-like [Prosopis cineraria]
MTKEERRLDELKKETIEHPNSTISLKRIRREDSMDLVNEPMNNQGLCNKHEVFMSFMRGEDTQESFPYRLNSSLKNAGICIIKDDTELNSEYDISIKLLRSIEGSGISIIMFSEHYASSKRCLDELAKIMDFRRARYLVVVTIFYGVHPSDVRDQKSNFGKEFRNLVQRISPTDDQVSRWTAALSEAGRMVKFVVPNSKSKNESEDIENIVKHVRCMLDTKDPFATDILVGLSSRVQEVITMLQNHQSKDVVSVGIWGMGGIGKSTIAKLIYENIRPQFESSCFLSNVREAWGMGQGSSLQSTLRGMICGPSNISIVGIELGSIRLYLKKVLVVLDDVNQLEQLEALWGTREWFGEGSRIIITTRDLHLLEAFQVDHVYAMKLLSNCESTELFNRYVFRQESPETFIELSRRMDGSQH